MSEWKVEVVRIEEMEKHPNADTLSITHIHGGYPCILRTDEWNVGDLAVYIPVDSLVPRTPEFEFAFPSDKPDRQHERIRAKKLRGIFSMGLLVKPTWSLPQVGDDGAAYFGITKWEPPDEADTNGMIESDPGTLSVYDIEGLRRYSHILQEGEEVYVTEKIHGANGRWFWHTERNQFYAGGRTQYHKQAQQTGERNTVWWEIAERHGLWSICSKENVALYGEVYGKVQKLRYGLDNRVSVAFFDARNLLTHEFLSVDEFRTLCDTYSLPMVPFLYRGPFSLEKMYELAEGPSTVEGANHVREGIVIRPVKERWDPEIQRVILKLHGEGYLTNKHA